MTKCVFGPESAANKVGKSIGISWAYKARRFSVLGTCVGGVWPWLKIQIVPPVNIPISYLDLPGPFNKCSCLGLIYQNLQNSISKMGLTPKIMVGDLPFLWVV